MTVASFVGSDGDGSLMGCVAVAAVVVVVVGAVVAFVFAVVIVV